MVVQHGEDGTPKEDEPPIPAPDPLGAGTPQEFVRQLRALKAWSGDPSYRELERRTALPRSTLADVLSPRRDRLPALERVLTIVTACGVPDEAAADWKTAWQCIHTRQRLQADATRAAAQDPPPEAELPPASPAMPKAPPEAAAPPAPTVRDAPPAPEPSRIPTAPKAPPAEDAAPPVAPGRHTRAPAPPRRIRRSISSVLLCCRLARRHSRVRWALLAIAALLVTAAQDIQATGHRPAPLSVRVSDRQRAAGDSPTASNPPPDGPAPTSPPPDSPTASSPPPDTPAPTSPPSSTPPATGAVRPPSTQLTQIAYLGRVGGVDLSTTPTFHGSTGAVMRPTRPVNPGDTLVLTLSIHSPGDGPISIRDTAGNTYEPGGITRDTQNANQLSFWVVVDAMALTSRDSITLTWPPASGGHLMLESFGNVAGAGPPSSAGSVATEPDQGLFSEPAAGCGDGDILITAVTGGTIPDAVFPPGWAMLTSGSAPEAASTADPSSQLTVAFHMVGPGERCAIASGTSPAAPWASLTLPLLRSTGM